MKNFNAEELKALREKVENLRNAKGEELTTVDYLKQVLLSELPTEFDSETAASNFIAEVTQGVENFRIQYDAAMAEGKDEATAYGKIIDKALENIKEEEHTKYLTNLLVALRSLPAEDRAVTEEDIKAASDAIAQARLTNEQLRDAIVVEMQNHALIDVEALGQFLDKEELNAANLQQWTNDEYTPLYMAVAAYIASKKGELELPEDITPTTLGAAIAAGVKMEEATAQLADGLLDLPKWACVMRVCVAVLLCLAVCVAISILAVIVYMPIVFGIFNLFNSIMVATILSYAFLLPYIFVLSTAVDAVMDRGMPLFMKAFDHVFIWTKKAVEYIKQKATEAKQAYQDHRNTQTQENPAPVQQTEPGLQPAMVNV